MIKLNQIFDWFMGAIKWSITALVSLALVISAIVLFNISWISEQFPTKPADLQRITVTVRSAVMGIGPQFVTPAEFPTQFEINGKLSPEVVATHPVNPGDQVDVYLTQEEAQTLREGNKVPKFMPAYGVTLKNGEKLIGTDQFLNGKVKSNTEHVFVRIFAFSLVYLLCFFSLPFIKRKYMTAKRHNT